MRAISARGARIVWALAARLVLDRARLDVAHHRARILGRQVREEHAHGRLREAHHHEGEEADKREGDDAHRRNPRRPEPREEFHRRVHLEETCLGDRSRREGAPG
jgi:hypothetical protein